MKVLSQIILFALFIGHISCQTHNDLDVDDIKKKMEELVPEVNEIDLNKFNKTLPNAEDVENVLNEKCRKNGADNAVELLKEQQENVKVCLERYVNVTVAQAELEKAKETGSMDEVFGKYCKKWPAMYQCFDDVVSLTRSCMDDKEEKAFNKSLGIISELQDFMCFKDGDRLAMFVAEGGVECVQEQKDGIQECLNSTLGARLPEPDNLSVATLPSFLFSPKDCEDFDKIRECVNVELEKCKDSTPANIVDAFFKFLKSQMTCVSQETTKQLQKSGSSFVAANVFLVVTLFLSLKVS